MSRITPGTMIVLIFAVLFGLVGAYAVRRHLEKPAPVEVAKPAPPPVEPMVTIPMASTDLVPGRELRLGDIALTRATRTQMKKMSLPPEFMGNPQQIIGRILRDPLKKGEAFQSSNFYPEGMGPTISERLKPGLRAVTIGVRGTGILSGLASVGSIVDVLFRTTESPTKEIPEATITLLEGVEVLAVQENIVPGAKNPSTVASVTLAVSSTQANALKIAEGRGEFSLALRSNGDETLVMHSGPQTLESLLHLPKRPKPQQIEVYRGGSRSIISFDRGKVVEEFTNIRPIADSGRPNNPQASTPVPRQVEDLIQRNAD